MKKISASLLLIVLAAAVLWLAYDKLIKTPAKPPAQTTQLVASSPSTPLLPPNQKTGGVWESDADGPPEVPSKKQTLPTFTPPPAKPSPTLPTAEIPQKDSLQKIGEESQEDWPVKNPPVPETKRENTIKVGDSNLTKPPQAPPNAEVLLPMEDNNRSTAIDPREAEKLMGLSPKDSEWEKLSPEKKLEQEHEPTNISVQRTFIAVLPNGEKQTIRVKVPVVYKSRMLRITPEDKKQVTDLLIKAKALDKKLQEAKKESEDILKQWNAIWSRSIPSTALLPESPSLPENQSASEINRPDTNPDLTPGKGASFQIK